MRFKRGDKVFRLKEVISVDSSSENEDEAALRNEFETLYLMNEDEREKKKKKKLSPNQKRCPIKCPKGMHVNGSLYFCNQFRRKTQDEMRSIIKKLFLCLTCLSVPGKEHICPVGKCRRCGGAHNILVCSKEEEDKGLLGRELDESEEDDSEDEAFEDFTRNNDNINLARSKPEEKKEVQKSRGKKQEKEQKDSEKEETKDKKKNQLMIKKKR